jgi:phage shock protein A
MSERLMEKVVRIISGSANMVVKKVENKIPEVIMSEAVREVDGVIDEVNAELGQIEVAIYQTNKRHAREHTRLDEISEKIKVALAQNREDLAEAAVSLQLDIEAQLPVLKQSVDEATERKTKLMGYVSALKAKKREMEDELSILQKLKRTPAYAPSNSGYVEPSSNAKIENRVGKAESAFNRASRAANQDGAISLKSSLQNAAALEELDHLSRKSRIAERLAVIKKEIQDQ